jgi:hypothetical protein
VRKRGCWCASRSSSECAFYLAWRKCFVRNNAEGVIWRWARALHIINAPSSNTMHPSEMSDPVRRPAHRLSTPRRRFNVLTLADLAKESGAWAKCESGGGARVWRWLAELWANILCARADAVYTLIWAEKVAVGGCFACNAAFGAKVLLLCTMNVSRSAWNQLRYKGLGRNAKCTVSHASRISAYDDLRMIHTNRVTIILQKLLSFK